MPCALPLVLLASSVALFAQARPSPPAAPDDALYQNWLNQDAIYIISDAEKNAFQRLKTSEAKEMFIQQFWLRRDPTSNTANSGFRLDHYRRMIYANDQFRWGPVPGWKTDRGMVYIKFGPPDDRERHPSGDAGVQQSGKAPFERWPYRYIEGVGNNLIIQFTDTSRNGEYRMNIDPAMKEATAKVYGFGMPLSALREPFPDLPNPPIRYKELDAALNSTIKFDQLPMQVGIEQVPVTAATSLAKLTIQFVIKDLQFEQTNGISTDTLYIRGRIKSTDSPAVTYFEDPVQLADPTSALAEVANRSYFYRTALPLLIGRYRISIAAKDANSGKTTVYETDVDVRLPAVVN